MGHWDQRAWSGLAHVRRGAESDFAPLSAFAAVPTGNCPESIATLLTAVAYSPPVRVEYGLTEMGRELEPALSELKSWARRWLDAPDKARAGRRGRTPAETR